MIRLPRLVGKRVGRREWAGRAVGHPWWASREEGSRGGGLTWAGVLFNSQCSDGILLASMLPSMGTRLGVMRGETGAMPGEYGICGISGAVGGGGAAARFGSLRGGGGNAASASFDSTSMSCTAVRLRLRSQARWRSRQCLRTASRDAYSLSHPGCLHTKRERSPVMRILQQLTARTLLSAEGGCVGFGLGGDFLIVGVMATQGAGGVVIVSSVMAILVSRRRGLSDGLCYTFYLPACALGIAM